MSPLTKILNLASSKTLFSTIFSSCEFLGGEGTGRGHQIRTFPLINWGFPPFLVSILNMVDITEIDCSEEVQKNVLLPYNKVNKIILDALKCNKSLIRWVVIAAENWHKSETGLSSLSMRAHCIVAMIIIFHIINNQCTMKHYPLSAKAQFHHCIVLQIDPHHNSIDLRRS